MVLQPNEMDFSSKKFSMIICGSPGIGKTTLALSAPNPILIDFDDGISRVKAKHRKPTISISKYEELQEDMKSQAFKDAETVVIDTGGSFITYLQDWAMRENPTQNKKKSGGISMQGFGAVKSEFVNFTNNLKTLYDKNIIYIFHTVEEKSKDDIKQRLMCEGSARNIVWQPCDLGCYLQIQNGERYMGFTPTEEYFAKGCYGISGLVKVPELGDDTPNTILTELFEQARKNMKEENKVFEEEKKTYDAAMRMGADIVDSVTDAKTAFDALQKIKGIQHALTSQREIKAMFTAKTKDLNLKWDKAVGGYVQAG